MTPEEDMIEEEWVQRAMADMPKTSPPIRKPRLRQSSARRVTSSSS